MLFLLQGALLSTPPVRPVKSDQCGGWRLPARWSWARWGGRRERRSTQLAEKLWAGAEPSQAQGRRNLIAFFLLLQQAQDLSGVGLGAHQIICQACPSLPACIQTTCLPDVCLNGQENSLRGLEIVVWDSTDLPGWS